MTTSPPTPSSTDPAPAPMTDQELVDVAVTALSAALDSADVDVIGVSHRWDRATSALRAAASAGSTWARVVSTLAKKLQIDTYRESSARTLTSLAARLDHPDVLGRWCYLAAADTPYIVALTRIQRDERKQARKTSRPGTPAKTGPDTLDLLIGDPK